MTKQCLTFRRGESSNLMTSFFPQTQDRVKVTSFPSFPSVLEGILEAEMFPTQVQGNTGCFRTEKTAKIHGNHLAVVGRDRHYWINIVLSRQRTSTRRWKAPENIENCHGGHDLKTPAFNFPWVSVHGFTDTWREAANSETSCETPVCCCRAWVCLCAANPPCELPEWQWCWKLHWTCRAVWELLPRHGSWCRYRC